MEGVVIDSEGLWDRAQEILLKRRNLIYEKDKIKVLLTGKSLQEGISIIKDFYNLKESVDTLLVERNILFKDCIKKINFIKGFGQVDVNGLNLLPNPALNNKTS